MDYVDHRLSLDTLVTSAHKSLSCKKGDTNRRLLITLSEGGVPYHLTDDCYVVFTATKPSGHVLYNECMIDNDVISYAFTIQTTSSVGKMDCEIRVYSIERGLLTSARFILIVYDTVLDDALVEDSSEFSMLSKLIKDASELIDDVEEKLANGEFDGEDGEDGKSAYEVAVANGFEGTEAEWLESLKYHLNDEDVEMIVEATLAAMPVAEEVLI